MKCIIMSLILKIRYTSLNNYLISFYRYLYLNYLCVFIQLLIYKSICLFFIQKCSISKTILMVNYLNIHDLVFMFIIFTFIVITKGHIETVFHNTPLYITYVFYCVYIVIIYFILNFNYFPEASWF